MSVISPTRDMLKLDGSCFLAQSSAKTFHDHDATAATATLVERIFAEVARLDQQFI